MIPVSLLKRTSIRFSQETASGSEDKLKPPDLGGHVALGFFGNMGSNTHKQDSHEAGRWGSFEFRE